MIWAGRSGLNFVISGVAPVGAWLSRGCARRLLDQALKDVRNIGQAATLMYALFHGVMFTHIQSGNYATAEAQLNDLVSLADDKSALIWEAMGLVTRGCLSALMGQASDAVQMMASGLTAHQQIGTTIYLPFWSSILAKAYADLDQFDDAWRCVEEAMTAIETTGETIFEAEVNRIAGEIALRSPTPDQAKAETYFQRALSVSRAQEAKSWELRAAMSLARLWRDQGKVKQARELIAPVYGWFTEGNDTRDLKKAKALLEELEA